jgi:hypothetical protein
MQDIIFSAVNRALSSKLASLNRGQQASSPISPMTRQLSNVSMLIYLVRVAAIRRGQGIFCSRGRI